MSAGAPGSANVTGYAGSGVTIIPPPRPSESRDARRREHLEKIRRAEVKLANLWRRYFEEFV